MKINRTALAAAASITAVVLAGTAALAANFGILGATDDGIDSSITPTVVASTAALPVGTNDVAAPAPELFAYQVEGVGVVTLERSDHTLGLSSVDVDPSQWSWIVDEDEDAVEIRFTSDSSIVSFSATLDDGEIVVDVMDETPIVDDDDHSRADQDDDDESELDDDASEREDDSGSVEDDD